MLWGQIIVHKIAVISGERHTALVDVRGVISHEEIAQHDSDWRDLDGHLPRVTPPLSYTRPRGHLTIELAQEAE